MAQKMERFQVYLETEMSRELDKVAAQLGVSKAELIRAGVKRILQEKIESQDDAILGIVGLGHGGSGRVSEKHDRYLIKLKVGKSHR